MYDFNGTNSGSNPIGSLISDGNYLYGMARDGGVNGVGTLFKIQIGNNAFSKMYDFDGTISGGGPAGYLISDGTYLYGMTSYGGANEYGTVFKFQISNNAFSKMYDFNYGPIVSYGPGRSLISDGSYLYGMSWYGGANNRGTIFKIQISNNVFTKIYDFNGTNSGQYPYGSLISDGTYLYGMTGSGGANNDGTIFKIQISNNAFTKMFDFDDSSGWAPFGSPSSTEVPNLSRQYPGRLRL
jgi:uncharacterized repeat protein (TIGR03803 family)